MKQGWEYKKVGSICDIFTGKLDANAANENGLYPFFTCSKTPLSINTYAYDFECVLIAGNGDLNVKYYNGKFNAYQRTYVLGLKDNWSYQLFKYQLEDKLTYLQQQSLGGLTKYLTMKILEQLDFIVPPIEKQLEFDDFVKQVDKSKFRDFIPHKYDKYHQFMLVVLLLYIFNLILFNVMNSTFIKSILLYFFFCRITY